MVCITVATTTYCKCSVGQGRSRAGRKTLPRQRDVKLQCCSKLRAEQTRTRGCRQAHSAHQWSERFHSDQTTSRGDLFSPARPSQADRLNLRSVYCRSGFEAALPTREKQRLVATDNKCLLFELRNRQMRRKHWRKCGRLENIQEQIASCSERQLEAGTEGWSWLK